MKNKTRIFFCLPALIAPIMAGCGGDGGSTGSSDGTVQLKFLGWGSLAEQQNFKTMIRKFMEKNPDIKVFYSAITDTTAYSTNLVNNADNLPDVFYVPDWDYIKWADAGKLLNLKTYLSEEEKAKMWPMSIDIFRWDSSTKTVGTGEDIYGLPKDLGPSGIVYNKDLILKLAEDYPDRGITLPSSTDPLNFTQFKEYLGKFKGLTLNGEKIVPITYYDVQCAVYSNNTNFYKDDSATQSNILDSNFIDAIQFVADLSLEGLAEDYASAGTGNALNKFASQRCVFSWMGPWDTKTFWENLSFEFDMMPVACGTASGSKSTATIGTVAYSVSANTKYKDAAVKLAKWLACSEEAAAMNYQLGQAMPNIKEMALNDYINNVGITEEIKKYPMSKEVFINHVKGNDKVGGKSRAYYYTYEKTAYDDLMDQFNPVWAGTKTAREVCEAYNDTYQQKLTKMHKNLE